MEFNFLGEVIELTKELEEYNGVRNYIIQFAENEVKKFEVKYSNAGNLDNVLKNLETWGREAATNAVNSLMDNITRIGIYTLNQESIVAQYIENEMLQPWGDALTGFFDYCAKELYNEQQMIRYREIRKNSRAKFVGGGFGISGAIKGSIEAGMINATTGLAHDIVNTVGNIASDIKINNIKSAIYENCEQKDLLLDGLYSMVASIVAQYVNIVWNEQNIAIGAYEIDGNAAEAIVDNINAGRIGKENIKNALIMGIRKDVYCWDIYALALCYYGDENKEIEKMGEYFSIDVGNIKKELLERFLEPINERLEYRFNPLEKEELVKMKSEITNWLEFMGMQYDSKNIVISQIETRLNTMEWEDSRLYGNYGSGEKMRNDVRVIYKIADNETLSVEKALELVRNLNIETRRVSYMRESIFLRRRKLLSGDKHEFVCQIQNMKDSFFPGVYRDRKPQTAFEYDGAGASKFAGRYLEFEYDKCNKIFENLKKQITFKDNEILAFFVGKLNGENGLAITNYHVLSVENGNVKIKIPLIQIKNVDFDFTECAFSTIEGQIIKIKMYEFENKYAITQMKKLFNKMLELINLIDSKKKIDTEGLEEMVILPFQKVTRNSCIPLKEYIVNNVNLGENNIFMSTYEDRNFKRSLGLLRSKYGIVFDEESEIPFIFTGTIDGQDLRDGIVVTSDKIYFLKNKLEDSISWLSFDEISVKKGMFGNKIIFKSHLGSDKYDIPVAYIGKENQLLKILEHSKIIASNIYDEISNSWSC